MVNSSAADQNTSSPVSSTLKIEVEQVDNENNDRWTGEFTSNCKKQISNFIYIFIFIDHCVPFSFCMLLIYLVHSIYILTLHHASAHNIK